MNSIYVILFLLGGAALLSWAITGGRGKEEDLKRDAEKLAVKK